MSSLEEYNVNLFLSNLSKLKIVGVDDKLFGDKKEAIFREYENFPEVLNGLAKLSRHLEKRTGVKGYDGDKRLPKSFPDFGCAHHLIDWGRAKITFHLKLNLSLLHSNFY